MRRIPLAMRHKMADDPYYAKCARAKDGGCSGRITWEHVWIYAGRQINEIWAIIPLCWFHHLGDGFNKKINEMLSLDRATAADLAKYPKKKWPRHTSITSND